MVIAAMCAEGMTLIEDAHFIERGYEDIVGKLTALGAAPSAVSKPTKPPAFQRTQAEKKFPRQDADVSRRGFFT